MSIPSPAAITAVILAGGRSRRMQGREKGLLPLAGRPLIAHVLERLRPQVGQLIINANRHLSEYAALGHPVVADTLPDYAGPLAGLLAGFAHTESQWLLTAPCDTPLLPLDLVSRMLAELAAKPATLCSVHTASRVQAAFLLISRESAAELERYLLNGGRRVQDFIVQQAGTLADFPDQADAFTNINTEQELWALERRIRSAESP